MQKPQKILITILLGNLFVNLFISSMSANILLNVWGQHGHLIAIALVTPLIILFCEISPKTIAVNNPGRFSRRIISVLSLFNWIIAPLREVFLSIVTVVIRIFKLRLHDDNAITPEELDTAIEIGEKHGLIDKEEGSFIKSVLRFSRKEAENVMVPRNQAVFLPYESTIEEAVKIFLETKHVRLPVYKNDFDNIIGVLDSRRLVPYKLGFKKGNSIKRLLYSIHHYPATKELGELLVDFLNKKIQTAVVIDEYGGTAGIVTLSGILSELLGRSFSVVDRIQKPPIKKTGVDTFLVSGDLQIDDFNSYFSENISSTKSETIGGYLIESMGVFPKNNDKFIIDLYILRVKKIAKNKIESIEVIKKPIDL